jgi:flavin-dependent dehydrogenase
MSEVIVVGAGLAGMTAAIHCAKAGHDVRVLERYDRIGGLPDIHPSVDSTPMRPERLGPWLGFELKPPYVVKSSCFRAYHYGRKFELSVESFSLHNVERGSRSTSIDSYLYGLAQELGVKFEFGWWLRSQSDAAELPPNTIIATGLEVEAFEALNLPYQPVYGYIFNGRLDGPPVMVGWFDTYTRDYNYIASSNGVCFGLGFDRRPVGPEMERRWRQQLKDDEGVDFPNWHIHEGVVACKSPFPKLFSGNKILAGTLGGVQDPFLLFGVHSSLVSGKIAGIAIDDKSQAYDLFRKMTSGVKVSWAAKQIFSMQPHWLKKPAMGLFFDILTRFTKQLQPVTDFTLKTIPGYQKI